MPFTTVQLCAPSSAEKYHLSLIRVKKGLEIYPDKILGTLHAVEGGALVELNAPGDAIRVKDVLATEGTLLSAGAPVFEIETCDHQEQFAGLCVECGTDTTAAHFSKTKPSPRIGKDAFSLVHGIPSLTVNAQVASSMEKKVVSDLQEQKKLSLVFDLDHTLVHATTAVDDYPNEKDAHTFKLPGDMHTYLVKLRPGIWDLLHKLAPMYQMYLYSMGTRTYVDAIAAILDKSRTLFGDRILSRESAEARAQRNNGTGRGNAGVGLDKSLQDLFPFDWSMVTVVDDREDVWGEHGANLLWVPPFQYFASSAEVNPVGAEPFRLPSTGAAGTGGGRSGKKGKDADADGDGDGDGEGEGEGEEVEEGEEGEEAECEPYYDTQLAIVRAVLHTVHMIFYYDVESADEDQDDDEEKQKLKLTLPQSLHTKLTTLYSTSASASTSMVKGVKPDVRSILAVLRKSVLNGVCIVLSGVIPVNMQTDPKQTPIWRIAEQFGAKIDMDITDSTTHVVATRLGSPKVIAAASRSIPVVTVSWLLDCVSKWCQMSVDEYILKAEGKGEGEDGEGEGEEHQQTDADLDSIYIRTVQHLLRSYEHMVDELYSSSSSSGSSDVRELFGFVEEVAKEKEEEKDGVGIDTGIGSSRDDQDHVESESEMMSKRDDGYGVMSTLTRGLKRVRDHDHDDLDYTHTYGGQDEEYHFEFDL